MNERDNQERQRERDSRSDLDNRYGKIGISAVAAAICHQGDAHRSRDSRSTQNDRD